MSCMITILACENNIDRERERETKWKMRWLLKYVLPDKLKLHLSKCLQEPVNIYVLMLKLLKDVAQNNMDILQDVYLYYILDPFCPFGDCSFSCLQVMLKSSLRLGKHCSNPRCFPEGPKAQHALSAASCSWSFRAVGEPRSTVQAGQQLKTLTRYLPFSWPVTVGDWFRVSSSQATRG